MRIDLNRNACVVALMMLVIGLWPIDKILSKIVADLQGEYSYTTVVPNSLFTLLFNLAVLLRQMRAGLVTRTQIRMICKVGRTWSANGLWKYLVISAVSMVFGNITGLMAQPYVTVFMDQLMCQGTTPWTVICSMILLGTRYTAQETIAVLVILCAASAGGIVGLMSDPGSNNAFWAIFDGVTTCFAALSYVLKEMTFRDYKALTRGAGKEGMVEDEDGEGDSQSSSSSDAETKSDGELDVFLVGTICALAGLLVSLPADLILHYIMHPPAEGEPGTLEATMIGLQHLFSDGQTLAWYSLYISVNLVFNVFFLLLTNYGSALTCFVCLKICTPIIGILSSVDWPVIGAHPVDSKQWALLVVMLGAVWLYRDGTVKREQQGINVCCWPLCGTDEDID
eukprot:TRINITY_DN59054_c0_g1_i1.p1 TRINITY_DN59054_c0_g1~~TRINITY_DN59054_c0_g1_i1.p1  ORF type:complete len:396 (-),score=41.93 TRINITY_DN59054_c0_g1_i1:18-1205(-)